jgi:hypothetical protein
MGFSTRGEWEASKRIQSASMVPPTQGIPARGWQKRHDATAGVRKETDRRKSLVRFLQPWHWFSPVPRRTTPGASPIPSRGPQASARVSSLVFRSGGAGPVVGCSAPSIPRRPWSWAGAPVYVSLSLSRRSIGITADPQGTTRTSAMQGVDDGRSPAVRSREVGPRVVEITPLLFWRSWRWPDAPASLPGQA